MARSIIKDFFIKDDSGFIIDRLGNILPTFIDSEGVYSIVEEERIPLIHPKYKGIKYLKSKGVWKTYVSSSSVEIKDNKEFSSEIEAAEYVNQLYSKYGLDRVPNVIPKENNICVNQRIIQE